MDARCLVAGPAAGGAVDRAADVPPSLEPARMRLFLLPLAVLGTAALLPACRTAGDSKSGAPTADVFAVEDEPKVRLALYEYADGFSATVQNTAFAIADAAKDPAVRRRTVEWKLQSITSIRSIVARSDPRSALADAWTYTLQMHHYFQGEGAAHFGEHQPLVVAATEALVADVERVAASLLAPENLARAREEIRQFVVENPVRAGLAGQVALPSEDSKEGRLAGLLRSPLSAINPFGGIDEGAQAIREFTKVAFRFTEVIKNLPETVSWRMELILLDLEEGEAVRSLDRSASTIAASAAGVAESARRLPEDVQRVLSKTLEDVEARSTSLRETIREARGTVDSANAAIAGAKELAVAVEEAGRALERTGIAGERMAIALGLGPPAAGTPAPPESAPSGEKGEDGGFDPKEFGDAADRLTRAAVEVQNIVREVKALAGSKEMEATVSGVNAISRSTVDHLAWRGLQLIGAVLLAALLYRLVSSRIARPR